MSTDAIEVEWPSPDKVRALRLRAGLTQAEAAELVGLGAHTRWSAYESGRFRCEPLRWFFFLLMTDQHPTHRLTPRA